MKIKEKMKKNKWNIGILIIYAISTFVVAIIFHEKWRDEAQAWLIARDLNVLDIIKQMVYEGHPPLWHFILVPFAKLGFPYITQSIISWAIMCITAWLILTKIPFKKGTQILILLSVPFLYLYPAIARSYCLIPLAIVLIAIYYPVRKQKPIQYVVSILLLAYTHVLMLGLVGILYLFFFLELIFYTKKDKKDIRNLIITLAIAVIGLACLALMLWGGTTKNTELSIESIFYINIYKIKMLLNTIAGNLLGIISYSSGFKIAFILFGIALMVWLGRKNPQGLVIALVSIGWQLIVYLCIFGVSGQKAGTILLICLFIAWISIEERKIKGNNQKKIEESIQKVITMGCLIILVLNSMEGITQTLTEIEDEYSNAKEAAQYIEKNLEENAIFICTYGPFASAIIPYTENKKFWNPASEQYFTYMTWDKISNTELEINEIIEKVKNNFTHLDKIYLLKCNKTVEQKENSDILELQEKNILSEVLYSSKENTRIYEEVYDIYQINIDK